MTSKSTLKTTFPNLKQTQTLATLCQLAYKASSVEELASLLEDRPNLTAYFYAKTAPDTDVFIASCSELKRVIVIFRGSESAKDWIINAQFFQVQYRNQDCCNIWNHFFGTKVHKGFKRALFSDDILDKIENVIDIISLNNPDYKILVTGHSLGAALSVLCGVHLSLQRPTTEITVENFGCPRVGNEHFRNWVDEIQNLSIWRYVYDDDIVPHLPPAAFMCYRHVGHLIHLSKGVKVYYSEDGCRSLNYTGAPKEVWDDNDTNAFVDHVMPSYLKFIEILSENDPNFSIDDFECDKKVAVNHPGRKILHRVLPRAA